MEPPPPGRRPHLLRALFINTKPKRRARAARLPPSNTSDSLRRPETSAAAAVVVVVLLVVAGGQQEEDERAAAALFLGSHAREQRQGRPDDFAAGAAENEEKGARIAAALSQTPSGVDAAAEQSDRERPLRKSKSSPPGHTRCHQALRLCALTIELIDRNTEVSRGQAEGRRRASRLGHKTEAIIVRLSGL